MSMLSIVMSISLPVLALGFSVYIGFRTMKKTGNGKKAFSKHFYTLAAALILCFALTTVVAGATAEDATAVNTASTAAASGMGLATGLGLIGAALSVGLAAIGGGIALSGAAPAAIGATAEDPKSFGKSIIFVALGEAVAVYGLIIAFLIIFKIPDLPNLPIL